MKVICYAVALCEGWSDEEDVDGPKGSSKKDETRPSENAIEIERKREARNRKKGRNAQGKSVISFCACGYDISNRLAPSSSSPCAPSLLPSFFHPSGESS